MRTPEQLVKAILTYCDRRRTGTDIPGRLRKLGEEYGEVAEAASRHLASIEGGGPESVARTREAYLQELGHLCTVGMHMMMTAGADPCSVIFDDLARRIAAGPQPKDDCRRSCIDCGREICLRYLNGKRRTE